MTLTKMALKLIKFFDDDPEVSFRSQYRVWPFVAMIYVGVFAGAYSILLPPAPDSPHFIDPSLKFIVVFIMFIALMIKPTIKVAKK